MSLDGVAELIQRFEKIKERHPGAIPYSASFGRSKKPHLVISAIIHGDEVGTLPALVSLMEELDVGKFEFRGKLSFVLGNIPAARINQRYIDRDLNRSFGLKEVKLDEEKRALELEDLISDADLYVDLHQTIESSLDGFHITAFHKESYEWARIVGRPGKFVTHDPDEGFSTAGICSDEFAQNRAIPSMSIEFFQKGFSKEAEISTKEFLANLLNQASLHLGKPASEIKSLSKEKNSLEVFWIMYREKLQSREDRLVENMSNLQEVKAGEVLGVRSDNLSIVAPETGLILFPKYPHKLHPAATLPESLFVLAQAREDLDP
ncbi:MAG: hypothetical protein COV44_08090 [Deltaproteobacteria bacterium CG11_big_fil_rev_8_21_14_0_20_45_16]|nr:MAG: hypothetical protein COV44_08090 [Deltaproteobacteria bacterium CG11_big_fil_rev_8_21_14_0_20_45_16]